MKIAPICYQSIASKQLHQVQNKSKKFVSVASKPLLGLGCLAVMGQACVNHSHKVAHIKDVNYKKEILNNINIPNLSLSSLNSIVGGEEYKKLLVDFGDSPIHYTPGESLINKNQDDYVPTGAINRTYRINLHNHTKNSDGQMSVEQILNKAVKYADKVAEANSHKLNVKAPNSPFTIAITDHDSVEGCKEAIKIISRNPEKYKNLRVVLGCELTVENTMLKDKQRKPISIHMVLGGINPFDKDLNEFLNNKSIERKKLSHKFFNECFNEIMKKNPTLAKNLSFEELEEKYPTIKNGLNYPWYFAGDYIIQKANEKDKAEVKEIINKVQKNYPLTMDLQSYNINMEEAMNVINKQKYGYMTIAHPARINLAECLNNPKELAVGMEELFKNFKKIGGEKALAVELNYPYFGDLAKDTAWLEKIKEFAQENDLLPSGGLDIHGKSIFFSRKK